MPFDMPPVTRALLIANVGIFLLQLLFPDPMQIYFALWPIGTDFMTRDGTHVTFEIWQLVSYGFLHGSPTHILMNMFPLWMFGGSIERLFGARPFAVYYLTCVVGAAIAQLVIVSFTGDIYPTLGASGAVFGLLLAFGMMYPHQRIMLIIPPIPMKAWVFVTAYGAIELFLGVTGIQPGVAHFAHLGGMAAGFGLIQYWRGRLPFKPRRILMR
jgi:membrane associated rhomboid family serine protease